MGKPSMAKAARGSPALAMIRRCTLLLHLSLIALPAWAIVIRAGGAHASTHEAAATSSVVGVFIEHLARRCGTLRKNHRGRRDRGLRSVRHQRRSAAGRARAPPWGEHLRELR